MLATVIRRKNVALRTPFRGARDAQNAPLPQARAVRRLAPKLLARVVWLYAARVSPAYASRRMKKSATTSESARASSVAPFIVTAKLGVGLRAVKLVEQAVVSYAICDENFCVLYSPARSVAETDISR